MFRITKACITVMLCILLCSCSSNTVKPMENSEKTEAQDEIERLNAKITEFKEANLSLHAKIRELNEKFEAYSVLVEDIKKFYIDRKITDIIIYKENYVLIKSQEQNPPDEERCLKYYTLYDLTTGQRSQLGDELIEIINENEIVFLDTGISTYNLVDRFPHIKRYKRENASEEFKCIREDYYLPVEEGSRIGGSKSHLIHHVEIEEDNIALAFEPPKTEEGVAEYFVDFFSLPSIVTSYNKDKNQLILTLSKTEPADTVKESTTYESKYFKSIRFKTYSDYCECIIELTDEGKEYHIDNATWTGKIDLYKREYELPKAVIKFR